jgi:hypothetical protein
MVPIAIFGEYPKLVLGKSDMNYVKHYNAAG